MSKNIPDEKFDAVIKEPFARSAMDVSEVNGIADSPAAWWAVQRRIAEQKDAAKPAWPPGAPEIKTDFIALSIETY